MLKMDQIAIENLLSKLDNENYLFPPFKIIVSRNLKPLFYKASRFLFL